MNSDSGFRILVIADVHYVSGQAERRFAMGVELIRRAIEDARRCGGFDCLALMGDLVNDGHAPGAMADLKAIRDLIDSAAAAVPLLVVPGNHDANAEMLLGVFGHRPGVHRIGPYRFFTFADPYAEGDVCTRRQPDRRRFLDEAGEPGPPIIALQHNPMNPVIQREYPYMLTNRDDCMRDYASSGVVLSISGHYHPGQSPNTVDGVRYLTAAALCEPLFSYAMVTLRRREVLVEQRALALEGAPAIVDCHAHTEFAYCAEDVDADGIIERSRMFGLAGVCLAEHAGQLYCGKEDFWAGRHIRNPSVWRSGENPRMPEFRKAMLPKRDDFVRIGLEVELDDDGELTIRDEDRHWPDLLIGAVHWIREDPDELGDAQLAAAFMRTTEDLLRAKVHVLAHPWRFFTRAGRTTPTDLYGELAQRLARAGVAAEINFHTNRPDPVFFAECIRRRVKIALGSDAHALHEAGGFASGLAVLREALRRLSGRNPNSQDIAEVLFYPTAR